MKLISDLPIDAMPNGIATLMPRSTVATTATKKNTRSKKIRLPSTEIMNVVMSLKLPLGKIHSCPGTAIDESRMQCP